MVNIAAGGAAGLTVVCPSGPGYPLIANSVLVEPTGTVNIPVEPGVPAVLDNPRDPFRVAASGKDAKTTGRRKAFAEWLTKPDHPLTGRVFVNRVWAAYFGTGIVATLDNFGKSGMAPTNQELLDWLATEFVGNRWNMKWVHRSIVTSSTYRQASAARPEGMAKDPDDQYLWRMPPRRLEARRGAQGRAVDGPTGIRCPSGEALHLPGLRSPSRKPSAVPPTRCMGTTRWAS
jgi:hypothetical protein